MFTEPTPFASAPACCVPGSETEAARRGRQRTQPTGGLATKQTLNCSPRAPDTPSASGTPPARGLGPVVRAGSSANPAGRQRQHPGSSRGIGAAPPGRGR